MKKNRLIFYSVIGVLHLLVFLFTLYMDSKKDDLQFLINLSKIIWLIKYAMFVLLVLFVTNFILHMRDNKRHKRENMQLIQELNTLIRLKRNFTICRKPRKPLSRIRPSRFNSNSLCQLVTRLSFHRSYSYIVRLYSVYLDSSLNQSPCFQKLMAVQCLALTRARLPLK
jgi:hypothetical protein